MSTVLDQTRAKPLKKSPHGWPDHLYVIRFPDGRYAWNAANTEGMDIDPMYFKGLAVHRTGESVRKYLAFFTDLPRGGEPQQMKYESIRALAIERKVDALILYEGSTIVNVEFIA